jgi:hypothetical protein
MGEESWEDSLLTSVEQAIVRLLSRRLEASKSLAMARRRAR